VMATAITALWKTRVFETPWPRPTQRQAQA
jgi:hypothetical protein